MKNKIEKTECYKYENRIFKTKKDALEAIKHNIFKRLFDKYFDERIYEIEYYFISRYMDKVKDLIFDYDKEVEKIEDDKKNV